ncbi:MAG: hypothetical protein M1818_001667 [Claussenomyces sp. TS43310]|nr:MAG: hypothetical protein M1818_001667 [Claussenomyces sp. TS43310]
MFSFTTIRTYPVTDLPRVLATVNVALTTASVRAPKLCEVLAGQSCAPWSRPAFQEFLSRQYCSEVLDFTVAVSEYRRVFELKVFLGHPKQRAENAAVAYGLWQQMMDAYIRPNAPREINIPGTVRTQLLAQRDPGNPPSPDLLQAAYNLMMELMNGVFFQFVESSKSATTVVYKEKPPYERTISSISEKSTQPSLEQEEEAEVPFYKRAHGLWGSSRVYRRIRKTPIDNKVSPAHSEAISNSPSTDHTMIFGKR